MTDSRFCEAGEFRLDGAEINAFWRVVHSFGFGILASDEGFKHCLVHENDEISKATDKLRKLKPLLNAKIGVYAGELCEYYQGIKFVNTNSWNWIGISGIMSTIRALFLLGEIKIFSS